MLTLLLSAMLLTADQPAAAAAPAPATVAAEQSAKKVKERKICRTDDQLTGSNMKRRICRTESEWAKYNEGSSADDLKTMGSR